jgi:hypothetical protein
MMMINVQGVPNNSALYVFPHTYIVNLRRNQM